MGIRSGKGLAILLRETQGMSVGADASRLRPAVRRCRGFDTKRRAVLPAFWLCAISHRRRHSRPAEAARRSRCRSCCHSHRARRNDPVAEAVGRNGHKPVRHSGVHSATR